jgi:hypothetical protein
MIVAGADSVVSASLRAKSSQSRGLPIVPVVDRINKVAIGSNITLQILK